MTDINDLYPSRLTSAQDTLSALPRRCSVPLGFFAAQPPALVQALADRAGAGEFDERRVHYMNATPAMATSLLWLDRMDVIKPHPFYMGEGDRVHDSKGALSFIVALSTAAHGKASRIVPKLQGPAPDPRIETQFIVTEHGMCDMRGKSSAERAMGLIAIADPAFDDELTAVARYAFDLIEGETSRGRVHTAERLLGCAQRRWFPSCLSSNGNGAGGSTLKLDLQSSKLTAGWDQDKLDVRAYRRREQGPRWPDFVQSKEGS